MNVPPRAAAVPSSVVTRRTRIFVFCFLLLFVPLALLLGAPGAAAAAAACTPDTGGANDQSGQKDLTRFCVDGGELPSTLSISWQWDQAGWSGSNSGDACALFDTDGDGNANYSLCTIVAGTPPVLQGRTLVQCSDTRPEQCPGAVPAAVPDAVAPSCTAGVAGTLSSPADPFPGGDEYPLDTVGACTIPLAALGGAAVLLDVCSYPLQQPDANPADCVRYRSGTGRLEVRKTLRPASDPGRFNLLIDSSIGASVVGDGGTTGEKIVDAGRHTVSETTATNTNLGDYNTWIECRSHNGSGPIVAAQANNSPLALDVPDGSDIVCTILNVRQTGIIYVTKVVDWNGIPVDPSQTFEVCIYGPSYPEGNCQTTDYDGGLLTWPDVETGYYDVVETDPGHAWSVVIDSSPVLVPCNGSVSATITNTRKRGGLEVTKSVNWNGYTPDTAKTFEICITGPSYPAPSCKNADFDGGVLRWPDLLPGSYSVTETNPGSQWHVVIADSPVTIQPYGATETVSVANTRTRGSLTVTKVVKWNGVTPDPNQTFDICITGPSYTTPNCQSAPYTGGALNWFDLLPGAYTVTERDAGPLWTTVVQGSPAAVVAGGPTATAAVVNTRKLGSLEVAKVVNWNGAPEDAGQFFAICIAGPSYPAGDCQTAGSRGAVLRWTNLIPGPYIVSETDPGSHWLVTVPAAPVIVPGDGSGAKAAVTNTHKRGKVVVWKTVDWNGSPPNPAQSFEICLTGPSHPAGNCLPIGYSGGQLWWYDLIPGDYTVTETALGSQWTTTIGGSPARVIGDGGTAPAWVHNTFNRGSLTVIKVVEWNGVTPDPAQTFPICITGPSFPQGDCRAADFDGGALVWENLIPGDYSISETALGSDWIVTIVPSQVTVTSGGAPVGASVVNRRKLGGLNITKVVNWNGVLPNDAQTFEICISGPSYPGGDCKTADYDGDTLSWQGLIPGQYRVAEKDPGPAWAVTVDSPLVTVPTNGGSGAGTITNTRQRGSLTVAKVVNWNGIAPDRAKTFLICISGPSFPGGDCKTADFDGGPLQWNELLPGSYRVSERDPGREWTVAITGSPAVVPEDGASVSATVLNTRKLGSLRVRKTVNWNGVPQDADQSFTICITGPSFTNGDCKRVGAGGGVLTWPELMPGSYVVAENNPGRVWETVIAGSPAVVPDVGGEVSAEIVNTRLQPARITVTKLLTDTNQVAPAWSFVLRLNGGVPKVVTAASPTVTWENLEPNRSYIVSEDEPAAPWVEGEFVCAIGGVGAGETQEGSDIRLVLRPGEHAVCSKYNGQVSGASLELGGEPTGGYTLYLPAVQH
jgi:hypothetical protein